MVKPDPTPSETRELEASGTVNGHGPDSLESEEASNALRGILRSGELRVLGIVGLFTGYLTEFCVKFLKFTNPYIGVAGISILTILILCLDEKIKIKNVRDILRAISLVFLSLLLTAPQLFYAWTVSVEEVKKEIYEEQKTIAQQTLSKQSNADLQPPLITERANGVDIDQNSVLPTQDQLKSLTFTNSSDEIHKQEDRICEPFSRPILSQEINVKRPTTPGIQISQKIEPEQNCIFFQVTLPPADFSCFSVPDPNIFNPNLLKRACLLVSPSTLSIDVDYVTGTRHEPRDR